MSDHSDDIDGDHSAPHRVDKRHVIRELAERADLPIAVAAQAYEAFISVIFDNVRAGKQVNLTGFGKFYRQRHSGHKVQFGGGEKPDYTVLKFSATRQSNEFLDLCAEDAARARVPGTRRIAASRPQDAPAEESPTDQ